MAAVDESAPLSARSRAPARILVVDADVSPQGRLAQWLREDGFLCMVAASGADAVRLTRRFRPHAVVLDVTLPDMDGLEVMRRLRRELPFVPVVFLTAPDAVADRIAGLAAGGDDCVSKPFSFEEVSARLRALLRRSNRQVSDDVRLIVGDLVLDEESHEALRAGEHIRLTGTEFELLRYLMRNPGQVLSKAQIRDRVWQYDTRSDADNVVQLYVSYLRRKIDTGRRPMIHTLRGAGYVLRPAVD